MKKLTNQEYKKVTGILIKADAADNLASIIGYTNSLEKDSSDHKLILRYLKQFFPEAF